MFRLLAVLWIIASASATLGCGGGPALDVAANVDLSRFQGKWYEIARLPRSTQTDCHGTTAFYTQGSDGSLSFVNQCNVGSATGPLKTVSMIATVPNAAVNAKLALNVGGYVGDYWILEVGPNYEYAVVGHPSRLYLWILSRTPLLDPPTLQGIEARAKANLFDTSQLEYTPQPPAGERNDLTTPQGPVPPAMTTGCSFLTGGASATDEAIGAAGLLLALGLARVRRAAARQICRP
jgi:apolipoprotein D and lipocalin family protein